VRATQGSEIFTVVDCKETFYHIEIEEKDKHKTTFKFNKNHTNGIVWLWEQEFTTDVTEDNEQDF